MACGKPSANAPNAPSSSLGKYTYNTDGKGVCLDSMLNFQLCWSIRNYMRHGGNHYGHANGIERAMKDLHGTPEGGTRPYYNPTPGPSGLNARQQSITFVENHDGINRFRVDTVTARRNTLANALVLTLEGIPCLYYGTEDSLHDPRGRIGQDSETGRLTFIKKGDGKRVKSIQSGTPYLGTRSLIRARRSLPALRYGQTSPLWVDNRESNHDDGTFVYARYIADKPGDTVIVGFNLSLKNSTLQPTLNGLDHQPLLPPGTVLERIPLPGLDPEGTPKATCTVDADSRVSLPLPADSVSIWRVQKTPEPAKPEPATPEPAAPEPAAPEPAAPANPTPDDK